MRALVDGGVAEIVLVAQDLAWYGRDVGEPGSLAPLLRRLDRLAADGLTRVRLLYLYPSEVRDPLVATMLELPTVVPVLRPLAPARRRAAAATHEAVGERRPLPRARSTRIRAQEPDAAFRSSFIVGFPGETETRARRAARVPRRGVARLGRLLPVLGRGRHAGRDALDDAVDRRARGRAAARVRGGAGPDHPGGTRRARRPRGRGARRRASIDDGTLVGRTHREAPEIDGIVRLAGADCARPGAIVARARHRGDRSRSDREGGRRGTWQRAS